MFGHNMGTVSNNYVAGDFSVLHVSSIRRIPYINADGLFPLLPTDQEEVCELVVYMYQRLPNSQV